MNIIRKRSSHPLPDNKGVCDFCHHQFQVNLDTPKEKTVHSTRRRTDPKKVGSSFCMSFHLTADAKEQMG